MPTLHLTTPGLRVVLDGKRIMVTPPVAEHMEPAPPVPVLLHEIERVFVSERVAISFATIAELLRRNLPVIILSHREDILGLCQPPAPDNTLRLAQYQRALDPAFALLIAATIVEAKILNQRRVLQRLAANRPEADATAACLALTRQSQDVLNATSLDSIRGHEGTSAARYFDAFGSYFPATAPFERRSRRPPHNAVNAVLSYAYTLLAAEAECLLHSIGLDPAIGFLHEPADRRPSLALDLIEPFRAPLADAMALDLFSHQILHPREHFEKRDGGVFMNTEGKRRFFTAYERRMERPFTSEQHGSRATLRAELERTAKSLKAAVSSGEPLEPFLMN